MSIFKTSSTATQTPHRKPGMLALLGVLAGISLFGATGCMAEVQAEPAYATYSEPVAYDEQVAYVDEAPVNVELYPRVYYGGTYVYYVGGRWYYPSARGWAYYRHEPRGLVSYRADFERRYPRGYAHAGVYTRSYHRNYRAPAPAHRSYRPSHASVSAHHHSR